MNRLETLAQGAISPICHPRFLPRHVFAVLTDGKLMCFQGRQRHDAQG